VQTPGLSKRNRTERTFRSQEGRESKRITMYRIFRALLGEAHAKMNGGSCDVSNASKDSRLGWRF
jgi:hypothetical protein